MESTAAAKVGAQYTGGRKRYAGGYRDTSAANSSAPWRLYKLCCLALNVIYILRAHPEVVYQKCRLSLALGRQPRQVVHRLSEGMGDRVGRWVK